MTTDVAPLSGAPASRKAEHGFAQLAGLVERHTGIKLPPSKRLMVEGRLRARLRALGMATLEDYYDHVFQAAGLQAEFPHIVDAVTTNKTDFFREAVHFDLLAETVVPKLSAAGAFDHRPLAAWSAACSTGAEAFTIAMVLAELAAAGRGPDFTVRATDICTDVLRKADRAIYGEDEIAPIPHALRQKYLLRSRDRSARVVRFVPTLRQRVKVSPLNLMDLRYPWPQAMDVIFCRNVLIYFTRTIQEQVLTKLCACLRPGGYLFVGHSETLNGMSLPVRTAGPSLYRRT